MTSYTYSITSDFTNATEVDPAALQYQITTDVTVVVNPDYIAESGTDDIKIWFPSSLTAGQKTGLDAVVAAYTFTKLDTAMIFDAIVDTNGNGDYLLPSAAFNANHKHVFMRNGTYVETANVIVPTGGSLVGESGPNTIIYFVGAYSVKCDGSGGMTENTGTISATKDSTAIVGVGTTFTNLSVGDFILLGTNYFQIAAITDNTNLNLVRTYRGRAISNLTYIGQTMHTGPRMENFIISNSSATGLYFRGVWHFVLDSVACVLNTPNFQIIDCGDGGLTHIICDSSIGTGIVIDTCTSINMSTADIFNSTSYGIEIKGDSISVILNSCESSNNSNDGIYISGNSKNIDLSDCVVRNNYGYGIRSASTTENIMFSDQIVGSNESGGIDLDGKHNNVNGGCIGMNGGIGLTIRASDSCIALGAYISNTDGIRIIGDDNIIQGVRCKGNSLDGVHIATGATDTIAVYNNLKGNTGTNIANNGTTSETTGNKV